MLNPTHPISVLVRGLRTDLTEEPLAGLRAVMGSEQCSWETLLALANLHRVTLLWYLHLQQHGLAGGMPAELREYLDALLEQNRTRNRSLLTALERCLEAFSRDNLEAILLKGAAALADDLYGDPGARLMGDVDLLILPEQQIQVDQALRQLGFQVAEEDSGNPFYLKHHHLPPYHHPDWQVCLEVHQEITDFGEQKAFPTERLFARAQTLRLGSHSVKILHNSDRLLHNACHAMQQDAGWLYSWCSLHEWAEWDQLLRHEESSADFQELLQQAGEGGFALELKVYALLANQLFGSPVPEEWHGKHEGRHVNRFLAGLAWRGSAAKQPAVVRRHYLCHVLPRTWQTHHLNRQEVPFLRRLGYFLKLAVRAKNWGRLKR